MSFFDKMCHNQCATCRFIHINFLQFIYSESRLLFRRLYVGCGTFASRERGKEVWGREGGQEQKEIKSVPWATSWGVVKETKRPAEGSASPFCPAVTFCPDLEVAHLLLLAQKKAMNSSREEESGLGWWGKPLIDKAT